MTRRAILHIGRHKTGTTGLQLFLQSGGTELEKAGFYYALLEQDMQTILSEFSAFERVISHPLIAALARGHLDAVRLPV